MKIIAAPNSFKGALSAPMAARAMAAGIAQVLPQATVVRIPVADGGDGLLAVLLESLGGERRTLPVTGPCFRPVTAALGHVPKAQLAIVEMALASGLTLVPASERDPTRTTSYGTGELIRAGLDLGARRIVVGLGGSATCDGGMGVAQALGVRFLDRQGRELVGTGASLLHIHRIDGSGLDPRVQQVRIEGLCDVDSPFVGPRGAAAVYGPQKGATPAQVRQLEAGLVHLAAIIRRDLDVDVIPLAGAGAAGGLGGGLVAFLGARLLPGIERVLELVDFDAIIGSAHLVFTGEGRIDHQTVHGKAPVGVARVCQKRQIPCIALGGALGDRLDQLYAEGITALFSICRGPTTLEEAMAATPTLLSQATGQALRVFLAGASCLPFTGPDGKIPADTKRPVYPGPEARPAGPG